ncbi:uncharacterized protein VTP21DRAFT_4332 [Calcarisporiella thermophila]|uniref:uncharacterized protein n=1 Tax=Calcarisporiella thermophila TaxID=911321 RepID=UPI003742E84A
MPVEELTESKKRKLHEEDDKAHDKKKQKSEKKRKEKHKDNELKEKKKKKEKKNKKSKHKDEVASNNAQILPEQASPLYQSTVKLYIHLPPRYAIDPLQGIYEQLNAMLMKYVPQVEGVILSYDQVKFLTRKARIINEAPFCHFWISVKLLLWRPSIGMRLTGTISVQSPGHIGLVLYGTFNASIPLNQIPSDVYEWRPGDDSIDAKGEWVNKLTGKGLIDEGDGTLEFTVVIVEHGNNTLQVTGSLKR